MEITKREILETEFVGALIKEVDKIGLKEASEISDRIVKNQPFIMSLLIGYKFDIEEEQLNDIMKMLFVIYLYFERKTDISKNQINAKEFKRFEKTNTQFLKYFSGESTRERQLETNEQYLSNLNYKSLFTGVLFMSNTQIGLKKMNAETKGIVILGMKTLIDCLEAKLSEKRK